MTKTSNWYFWDWKSIFRTSILFSGLLILFAFLFIYPDWKRDKDLANHSGSTKGTVLSINPVEEISMTETGNKTVVYYYSICYRFEVNSKTYKKSEQVPNTFKIRKNISRMQNENQYKIKVKYNLKDPQNSQIAF